MPSKEFDPSADPTALNVARVMSHVVQASWGGHTAAAVQRVGRICFRLVLQLTPQPAMLLDTCPAVPQKGVQAGGVLGVGLVAPIVLAVHKYQVRGCRLRPVLPAGLPRLYCVQPRARSCLPLAN